MVFPNFSELRGAAAAAVSRDPSARKLVAIHSGVPALISLVLTALSYYLSLQISDTGGLGGLGTRAMLESLQSMLQVVNTGFAIFWSMSYVSIVCCWARGERANNKNLWDGFRRFGPVFRGWLLKAAVYFAVCFVAAQISSIVFSATPLADRFAPMFELFLSDPEYMPSEAEMLDFLICYLPFLGIVMLALCLPVYYRLRFMDFAMMDQPRIGAFQAMRISMALTRHNCIQLFKMDLRFWWFYGLELLTVVLYYGDWILELMGVDLGISSELLLFAACAVGLVSQLLLYVWRKNQVTTAYALAYYRLKTPEPAAEAAPFEQA